MPADGESDRQERARRLEAHYRRAHEIAVSHDRGDTPIVLRPVVERALESRLLLLAQGLARGTQRVTGHPYRRVGGLSPAGRRLDAFLRLLGHTIDHTDTTRIYAYSTDLVPWFPGRNAQGRDLPPTAAEVDECWMLMEEEIAIVRPQAIVLLGRVAARLFLNRHAGERIGRSRPKLPELAGRVFDARVAGASLPAVVAWHPSSAYGRFADDARDVYRRTQAVLAPLMAT